MITYRPFGRQLFLLQEIALRGHIVAQGDHTQQPQTVRGDHQWRGTVNSVIVHTRVTRLVRQRLC